MKKTTASFLYKVETIIKRYTFPWRFMQTRSAAFSSWQDVGFSIEVTMIN